MRMCACVLSHLFWTPACTFLSANAGASTRLGHTGGRILRETLLLLSPPSFRGACLTFATKLNDSAVRPFSHRLSKRTVQGCVGQGATRGESLPARARTQHLGTHFGTHWYQVVRGSNSWVRWERVLSTWTKIKIRTFPKKYPECSGGENLRVRGKYPGPTLGFVGYQTSARAQKYPDLHRHNLGSHFVYSRNSRFLLLGTCIIVVLNV